MDRRADGAIPAHGALFTTRDRSNRTENRRSRGGCPCSALDRQCRAGRSGGASTRLVRVHFGLHGARRVYSRYFGTTLPLVLNRLKVRGSRELRHIPQWRTLRISKDLRLVRGGSDAGMNGPCSWSVQLLVAEASHGEGDGLVQLDMYDPRGVFRFADFTYAVIDKK